MAKAEYLKDTRRKENARSSTVSSSPTPSTACRTRITAGCKLLERWGLWPYLLPEVAACAGVKQNPEYHKYDV